MDKIVLKIAKESIKSSFEDVSIDRNSLIKEYPFLDRDGASFVTLSKDSQLRGCIGSIIAHRKLIDDIIENAKSAAFKDPRFLPLSKEELEKITIEVSILTEPKLVEYQNTEELKSKIVPFKDGIVIKLNGYQATFLPQVWEQLPNFEDFFANLGEKAGIGSKVLEYNPKIYSYRVESVS